MKNITLAVDDETYRSARIRAAELDTSVSALVRDYLRLLTGQKAEETQAEDPREETVGERRRRLLREVVADFDARGQRFPGADTLSRRGRIRACRSPRRGPGEAPPQERTRTASLTDASRETLRSTE